MKLITSHQGTDFDSLAAMVAANKLYPDATMVFSGRLSQNVRDFMSLYKDRIVIKRPNQVQEEIDQGKVNKLIIVDTRIASRIGKLAKVANDPDVELIIYDHHPELDEELQGDWQLVKPVGAITSLLCQEIQERGIEITSFEATLFTLGIYEDTGCLTFTSTTSLDAAAVSFLLENEANLSVIDQFIERPLNPDQQDLFTQLLNSLAMHDLNGLNVAIYKAKVGEYIGGIAYLTHKLDDLNKADVVFTLVNLGSKILIVARSNVDAVSVDEIVTEYGGGGHEKAASAMMKGDNLSLTDLEEEIISIVEEKMKPSILAQDIMSSPVKVISPDESIKEAENIMKKYGYSGLIVSSGEKILGVISQRDVEKVKKHDLMHAPVKGYMSRDVINVGEGTTFKEIQQQMVKHDIGRLPVLDKKGKLVGIVTRSDILKVLYGQADYIKGQQNRHGKNMVEVSEESYDMEHFLKDKLDQNSFNLLLESGQVADELDLSLYVVGGFIRDILLGVENFDLDLVVEGDGIKFAQRLAEELKGEVIDAHQKFGTATIESPKGLKLDIASSRIEYYEYPAALPQVEEALLKQDLFRRDFTINALALQLNSANFGMLVDYFGGKEDLDLALVRVLHNFSFIDDPTRIFRALRFVNRYQFELESLTKELMEHAIEQDVIKGLSTGRLGNELSLILGEEDIAGILLDLDELELLEYFYSGLSWGEEENRLALEIPWAIKWINALEIKEKVVNWHLYLMILLKTLSKEEIRDFIFKFKFSQELISKIIFTKERVSDLVDLLNDPALEASVVYYNLFDLSIEELVYLLLMTESDEVKEWIKEYLLNLRRIELEVTGKDIIDLGYEPGPYFKEVLQAVKTEKLNGNLQSYEEEYRCLKKCLADFADEEAE